MTTDHAHTKWFRLASNALAAARVHQWDAAGRYTQRLVDECGSDGFQQAVLAWIDTYLSAAGITEGCAVRPVFLNVDSGELDTDADKVRLDVRWAGRLIMARANDDEPTYRALIGALPYETDQAACSRAIGALLNMCATGLNHLAAGQPVVRRNGEWHAR